MTQPKTNAGPEPPGTMRFNVLVVDDNRVMRKVMIRTLEMTGLPLGEIHEAGDGAEALELLRKHWIDLGLVDINMPIMNGEELIDRVRDDPELRDLQIIVVSTEGSEARIEKVMRQKASFVHKPFTPEQIREAVLGLTGVTIHDDPSDHPDAADQGDTFDF